MISVSQTPPDGSNRRAFPYPKERQAKALAVFLYPKFLLPSKILFARFFVSMIKKSVYLSRKESLLILLQQFQQIHIEMGKTVIFN